MAADASVHIRPGAPVVFRNGTVLPMAPSRSVLRDADVLIEGERISAVGPSLDVPNGTTEIDASGGIVMPGMIDTHRHMWQTAMRGYGADWTLTQYFVWNYLNYGKLFRPEDIAAGNQLSAVESLDAGVTTTVDWSHNLQTVDHAEAALDALRVRPGPVRARLRQHPGRPVGVVDEARVPRLRRAPDHARRRHARLPDGLRRHRGSRVPGARGLRGGPRARRPGDHARRGVGSHQRRRHQADARQRFRHRHDHLRARRDPERGLLPANCGDRGTVSVATESEQTCGQGYPPTWTLRTYDIPVALSMDTSVWWSADIFSAMRSTIGADRAREHLEAHAKGDTVTNCSLRADQVVEWATIGGAKALGLDAVVGSLEVGKKADVVLIKNDHSPVMFPMLHPYGHVVFQAQRGDVHTVVVNGRVVKHDHRLVDIDLDRTRRAVESTVEYLQGSSATSGSRRCTRRSPGPRCSTTRTPYTGFRSDETHRG